MSITLLCFIKKNTLANTFSIHIDENSLVGDFKKVIKEKNVQIFANLNVKDLKLWKVLISDDYVNFLNNLSLEDSNELLAINEIEDY